KTAIGAAVNPDPARIHAGQHAEIRGRCLNVSTLGRATRTGIGWLMEVKAITDAEPVVHREHDEPATRQVLIQRVGVRVIVRVVPTQQHLPRRTAVNIHDSGFATGRSLYVERFSLERQYGGLQT